VDEQHDHGHSQRRDAVRRPAARQPDEEDRRHGRSPDDARSRPHQDDECRKSDGGSGDAGAPR